MSNHCTYKMHKKQECGEPLLAGDSTCLYHSKDFEAKKKEGFNEAFLDKLDRLLHDPKIKVLNFKGYIFPDSISIEDREFNKDTYFTACQFHGEQTEFRWVTFSGSDTEFAGTHFLATTTLLEDVQFASDKTDFSSATFEGKKSSFSHSHFEKGEVDFRNAIFSVEELNLSHTTFAAKSTTFGYVKFLNKKEGKPKNTRVNLHSASIDNVSDLFESLQLPRKRPKFLRKRKHLIGDFRFHLGETTSAQYAVIYRKTRDAWYLEDYKNQHPFIYRCWNITAKCGEGIWRWGLLSLVITVIFALIFYCCFYNVNHTNFDIRHINQSFPFLTFWYFSIATFTTLGSGDIIPMNDWLQVVVMVEVFLGYIMLGGLISIFANKLARRS